MHNLPAFTVCVGKEPFETPATFVRPGTVVELQGVQTRLLPHRYSTESN
jgi:hypothetical protein